MIVHGDRDRTIFPRYSRILLVSSRHGHADLIALTERGLAEHPSGQYPYQLEGRLVLVRGEGHRCNGEAALAALLTSVEVLGRLPATS